MVSQILRAKFDWSTQFFKHQRVRRKIDVEPYAIFYGLT